MNKSKIDRLRQEIAKNEDEFRKLQDELEQEIEGKIKFEEFRMGESLGELNFAAFTQELEIIKGDGSVRELKSNKELKKEDMQKKNKNDDYFEHLLFVSSKLLESIKECLKLDKLLDEDRVMYKKKRKSYISLMQILFAKFA